MRSSGRPKAGVWASAADSETRSSPSTGSWASSVSKRNSGEFLFFACSSARLRIALMRLTQRSPMALVASFAVRSACSDRLTARSTRSWLSRTAASVDRLAAATISSYIQPPNPLLPAVVECATEAAESLVDVVEQLAVGAPLALPPGLVAALATGAHAAHHRHAATHLAALAALALVRGAGGRREAGVAGVTERGHV